MTESIFDFHTHLFAREFFAALAAQSPQEGTVEEKLRRVADATGLAIPEADTPAHVARWRAEMDAHGVEHLVSFASVPPEIPVLAEAARLADGAITPFALVDPLTPGAAGQVRDLVEEGPFRGVLLFPAVGHYRLSDPAVRPVLEVLQDARACAVVHCGLLVVKLKDLLGLPRTQDLRFANPLDVIPAANAFPGIHFVIPHFGAGFFRETLMAGSMCSNVYVDTSSSNSWRTTQPAGLTLTDVFRRALGVFGPERILFGTDSCTFPRGWRDDLLAAQRTALAECGVQADDTALILGGNARRLLRLRGV